jgi:hypothetical protein
MKEAFKIIGCVGILLMSGANAMDHTEDYNFIYQNTNKGSKIQEISLGYMSSGETIDLPEITEAAYGGDYVAQYLLAQYLGGQARGVHNGEREVLLRKKATLLLISAVKGDYWKSKDEINFALPDSMDLKNCNDWPVIQQFAEKIYRSL